MVVSDLSGRRFGEYTATEKIGQGGYGVVYRCEHGPLGRQVVVKVLLQRWSNEAQQRFLQEARLASRLRHTYAATVYTAGVDPDGFAWIAMELIEGVTLDAWLRVNGPMPPDQFAAFFAKVANVVDEAHRVGIVHRDLTPQNVMVVQGPEGLEPRLLDFGIATLAQESPLALEPLEGWPEGTLGENVQTDAEAEMAPLLVLPVPGRSRLTLPGERMGSASYMSPEQWSNVRTVGPATDIYSLGVIAYEALSGRVPFERTPTAECRRQHEEQAVPPLGGDFGPDVDLVIKRAMAKAASERHATAAELAADLRRALRSEREELRAAARYWASRGHASGLLWSSDMLDVLQNWQHRSYVLSPPEKRFVAASLRALHKRRVMRRAIGVLVAALACGTPAYLVEARAQHDHDVADARIEAKTTEEERQAGRTALLYGGPDALAHLTRAQEGGDASESAAFMRARAAETTLAVLARLAGANQRISAASLSPDGRHLVTVGPDGARVWNAESYQPLFTLPHPARFVSATFIADGSQLVAAGGDAVRIWSMTGGTLVRELARPAVQPSSSYLSVVASPDGKLIAATHMDGSVVHVWDSATGALIRALASAGDGHPLLAFSHDGRWLASAEPGDVHVYDTSTWNHTTIPADGARSLVFSPTDNFLAAGTLSGGAAVWDVATGDRILHMRDGIAAPATRTGSKQVAALAFSRDGRLVAVASHDGAEQIWRLSGELVSELSPRATAILSTEFEPGGKSILAANADGTVVVTDIATGLPITVLDGPDSSIREAHFMTGGRIVGGAKDAAWIWRASPPYRRWGSDVIDADCGVVTMPATDERYLAIGCRNHPSLFWDTASDRLIGTLPSVSRVEGNYTSAFPAISSKGDRAAIAIGNSVEVYALPGESLLYRVEHRAPVNAVMFGPDGRDLVTGATDGTVTLVRGGTTLALAPMSGGVDALAITEDGRILAADANSQLRIYRPDGAPVTDIGLPGRVMALRSAGARVVTVPIIPQYDTHESSPALVDLDSHQLVELKGHSGRVFSARWNGQHQLITAGMDHTVRRWDGRTGIPQQTYKGGSQYIADAINYNEHIMVAGGEDGVLRFWDLTSGELLWSLHAHQTAIVGLHVDGNDIVTRGFDGQVEHWSITANEAVLAACRQNARCAIVR